MGKPGAPLRLYAAIALVLAVPIILTDKYRGGVDDFAVVFLSVVMAGELFRTCLYWNRYRCPYCHNRDTLFYAYEGNAPDEKHSWYKCSHCPNLSIELNRKLVKRFV